MLDWITVAVLILQLVILRKQRKYHKRGEEWHKDLGNFYTDQMDRAADEGEKHKKKKRRGLHTDRAFR